MINRLQRTATAVVVIAGALLIPVAVTQPAAAAATGGYPYASMPCEHSPYGTTGTGYWCNNYDWGPKHTTVLSDPSTISTYGYAYRNCTDFVAWKLSTLGVAASHYKGLGSGNTWGTRASAHGVVNNTRPAPGSVAVSTSGDFGHVAFVTKVADGKITVIEYNKHRDGTYGTRTGTPAALGFTSFDHFEKYETANTPPPPSYEGNEGRAVVSDGYMFVYAIGSDGNLYYRWRQESTNDWSANWASRGAPDGVTLTGSPHAVVSDGYMFVYAIGSDGNLYYRWRQESTNDWSANWASRGAPDGVTLTGSPHAVVSDGYMFVYAIGSDGNLYYRWRQESTNDWSATWTSRHAPDGVTLTGPPETVVSDGYMFVYAVGSDGNLYYRWRQASTNDWSATWTSRHAPDGVTLTGPPETVVSDGYMFVYAVGSDGNLYYRWRQASTNDWSATWTSRHAPDGVTLTGSPETVVSDGYMFVYAVGSDGNLYYRWRQESTNDWSATWTSRHAPDGVTLTGSPLAVVSDGYLFVYGIGSDGSLYYRWRQASTNDWSAAWTSRHAPDGVTLIG